jgi:hypothetical protein
MFMDPTAVAPEGGTTPRRVAPIPDRPGWLALEGETYVIWLTTDAIVAVESGVDVDGNNRCWIHRRDGKTHCIGDVAPGDVLLAMDEADGEGPGALPPPVPYRADNLLARVIQRRDHLARTLRAENADAAIPATTLGLLRDQALYLAQHVSHPRDWLLLLRDAAMEAADQLHGWPPHADRYLALARQLERDVQRLPPGAPSV